MQVLVSFSQHNLERLFLTYKRNTPNYTKIKKTILGVNAAEQYKKNFRSRLFFFGAITFIIVVSSSFSLIADHMDSFIALWLIWLGALILFLGSSYIIHQNTSKVHQKNQSFFDKFEFIANKTANLKEFKEQW